jgi:hypothetical protein
MNDKYSTPSVFQQKNIKECVAFDTPYLGYIQCFQSKKVQFFLTCIVRFNVVFFIKQKIVKIKNKKFVIYFKKIILLLSEK